MVFEREAEEIYWQLVSFLRHGANIRTHKMMVVGGLEADQNDSWMRDSHTQE